MAYTNSKLVSYTKLSPNHSGQRTHSIDRITPHCVVGQLSAESICGCFESTDRQASCNYGIGTDGRVSLCVEEKNRSWCSSSNENDQRAITIECASDSTAPYAFNNKVYNSLVKLCTDICQRNGKKKLLWLGDKTKTLNYTPASDEMVLTVHRWFASKSCVPADTEVLTREGWVKLHDISIGDEIACASLDGLNITFEEVLDKVEERKQDTYTSNGLTATKDHRMVYSVEQSKDLFRIDYYKKLLREGTEIYIPMAGYVKNDGLPITDSMLTFLVAVQADGSYMYDVRKDGSKSYYGVEFHLRKDRKIKRLLNCLDECHLIYNITNQTNGTTKIRIYNKDGINIVQDICEKWLKDKCFTWDWLNLSENQAQHVLSELLLWDGCTAANLYTSRQEVNLDIISALAALNGVGSNVTGSNIQFRQNPYVTLGEVKRNQHGSQTLVSCVTVKTGIFLCRQNGKTFIIGNCPGDWMYARMGDLASKVTTNLGGTSTAAQTATTTTTTPTGTSSDEKTIWDALFAFIGNAYGTAGLMGNLYAESALKSNNLQNNGNTKLGMTDAEFTAAYDNGSYAQNTFIHDGYGYGLAQWTYYSRKQNLVNYAKSAGKSIGDLSMQLGFLCKELSGYASVLNTLKNATSVKEASDAVLTKFECPADQSDTVKIKRSGYGQTYYDKYAGKSSTATTTASTAKTASTGTSAAKVIAVAAAEIGYHEKASNASLDDKTANTGTANYTKYARDFDEKYPKWYNGKKNGYAWCDMFVDWCFLTAFGYETALKLLCQPEKSAGAGCTYSMGYYKNKGQFHTSGPKAGDQIFFGDSASSSSHTGLVEKADSSKVYTIEGNSSDQVIRRTYDLSNSRILGYGRPAYDSVETTATAQAETAATTTSSCPYMVRVSITDLNIRKGPGTNYETVGKYTGKGTFTIVEEADGQGATKWGLLKSYADERNGWISLDYAQKV